MRRKKKDKKKDIKNNISAARRINGMKVLFFGRMLLSSLAFKRITNFHTDISIGNPCESQQIVFFRSQKFYVISVCTKKELPVLEFDRKLFLF